MKSNQAFALLFISLTAGLGAAETASASRPTSAVAQTAEQTAADTLAGQIQDIASSKTLSRKSQAKMIAQALRVAITAVTDGVKDPTERLRLAMELVSAAAKAAPKFAATITNAAASLPALAGIDGISVQIQAAVNSGIASAEEAAGAENPTGNSEHKTARPEFGGPNKGEAIVSPSH